MTAGPSPPKSPQEKKEHSYVKDRRNSFGENDKASRKIVPRLKTNESKKDRRAINQAMDKVPLVDESHVELIESSARHDTNRVGGWTKKPGKSLADHLGKPRKDGAAN